MERESVDKDTALWLIEKTDRERSCLIHLLYGKHWDDHAEYDMVFDTGVKTLDEIVNIVKDTLLGERKVQYRSGKKTSSDKGNSSKNKGGDSYRPRFIYPDS